MAELFFNEDPRGPFHYWGTEFHNSDERISNKNQKKKFFKTKNKLKPWIRIRDMALLFFIVPIDGRESGSAILKLVFL